MCMFLIVFTAWISGGLVVGSIVSIKLKRQAKETYKEVDKELEIGNLITKQKEEE